MVTANSGAEVPKAIIVRPMIRSDMPRLEAIRLADSTSSSAPFHKKSMETRSKMILTAILRDGMLKSVIYVSAVSGIKTCIVKTVKCQELCNNMSKYLRIGFN